MSLTCQWRGTSQRLRVVLWQREYLWPCYPHRNKPLLEPGERKRVAPRNESKSMIVFITIHSLIRHKKNTASGAKREPLFTRLFPDSNRFWGSLWQADQGWNHDLFDFFHFWYIVSPYGDVLSWQKFWLHHTLVGVIGGWKIFRGAATMLISFFYGVFPWKT